MLPHGAAHQMQQPPLPQQPQQQPQQWPLPLAPPTTPSVNMATAVPTYPPPAMHPALRAHPAASAHCDLPPSFPGDIHPSPGYGPRTLSNSSGAHPQRLETTSQSNKQQTGPRKRRKPRRRQRKAPPEALVLETPPEAVVLTHGFGFGYASCHVTAGASSRSRSRSSSTPPPPEAEGVSPPRSAGTGSSTSSTGEVRRRPTRFGPPIHEQQRSTMPSSPGEGIAPRGAQFGGSPLAMTSDTSSMSSSSGSSAMPARPRSTTPSLLDAGSDSPEASSTDNNAQELKSAGETRSRKTRFGPPIHEQRIPLTASFTPTSSSTSSTNTTSSGGSSSASSSSPNSNSTSSSSTSSSSTSSGSFSNRSSNGASIAAPAPHPGGENTPPLSVTTLTTSVVGSGVEALTSTGEARRRPTRFGPSLNQQQTVSDEGRSENGGASIQVAKASLLPQAKLRSTPSRFDEPSSRLEPSSGDMTPIDGSSNLKSTSAAVAHSPSSLVPPHVLSSPSLAPPHVLPSPLLAPRRAGVEEPPNVSLELGSMPPSPVSTEVASSPPPRSRVRSLSRTRSRSPLSSYVDPSARVHARSWSRSRTRSRSPQRVHSPLANNNRPSTRVHQTRSWSRSRTRSRSPPRKRPRNSSLHVRDCVATNAPPRLSLVSSSPLCNDSRPSLRPPVGSIRQRQRHRENSRAFSSHTPSSSHSFSPRSSDSRSASDSPSRRRREAARRHALPLAPTRQSLSRPTNATGNASSEANARCYAAQLRNVPLGAPCELVRGFFGRNVDVSPHGIVFSEHLGRRNGVVHVEFRRERDLRAALRRNSKRMSSRFVSVTRSEVSMSLAAREFWHRRQCKSDTCALHGKKSYHTRTEGSFEVIDESYQMEMSSLEAYLSDPRANAAESPSSGGVGDRVTGSHHQVNVHESGLTGASAPTAALPSAASLAATSLSFNSKKRRRVVTKRTERPSAETSTPSKRPNAEMSTSLKRPQAPLLDKSSRKNSLTPSGESSAKDKQPSVRPQLVDDSSTRQAQSATPVRRVVVAKRKRSRTPSELNADADSETTAPVAVHQSESSCDGVAVFKKSRPSRASGKGAAVSALRTSKGLTTSKGRSSGSRKKGVSDAQNQPLSLTHALSHRKEANVGGKRTRKPRNDGTTQRRFASSTRSKSTKKSPFGGDKAVFIDFTASDSDDDIGGLAAPPERNTQRDHRVSNNRVDVSETIPGSEPSAVPPTSSASEGVVFDGSSPEGGGDADLDGGNNDRVDDAEQSASLQSQHSDSDSDNRLQQSESNREDDHPNSQHCLSDTDDGGDQSDDSAVTALAGHDQAEDEGAGAGGDHAIDSREQGTGSSTNEGKSDLPDEPINSVETIKGLRYFTPGTSVWNVDFKLAALKYAERHSLSFASAGRMFDVCDSSLGKWKKHFNTPEGLDIIRMLNLRKRDVGRGGDGGPTPANPALTTEFRLAVVEHLRKQNFQHVVNAAGVFGVAVDTLRQWIDCAKSQEDLNRTAAGKPEERRQPTKSKSKDVQPPKMKPKATKAKPTEAQPSKTKPVKTKSKEAQPTKPKPKTTKSKPKPTKSKSKEAKTTKAKSKPNQPQPTKSKQKEAQQTKSKPKPTKPKPKQSHPELPKAKENHSPKSKPKEAPPTKSKPKQSEPALPKAKKSHPTKPKPKETPAESEPRPSIPDPVGFLEVMRLKNTKGLSQRSEFKLAVGAYCAKHRLSRRDTARMFGISGSSASRWRDMSKEQVASGDTSSVDSLATSDAGEASVDSSATSEADEVSVDSPSLQLASEELPTLIDDIMALKTHSQAHLAPRFKAAVLAYQARHDLGNLATAELFGFRAAGHKVIAQWTLEHAGESQSSKGPRTPEDAGTSPPSMPAASTKKRKLSSADSSRSAPVSKKRAHPPRGKKRSAASEDGAASATSEAAAAVPSKAPTPTPGPDSRCRSKKRKLKEAEVSTRGAEAADAATAAAEESPNSSASAKPKSKAAGDTSSSYLSESASSTQVKPKSKAPRGTTSHLHTGTGSSEIRAPSPGNGKVPCPQCSSFLKDEKGLKAHMWRQHSGRSFVCEWCSREFTRIDTLSTHKRKCVKKAEIKPSTSTQDPVVIMESFRVRGGTTNALPSKAPSREKGSTADAASSPASQTTTPMPPTSSAIGVQCTVCSKILKNKNALKSHKWRQHRRAAAASDSQPSTAQIPTNERVTSSTPRSVPVAPKRCSNCKRRHTKCDMQTPCGACVKGRGELAKTCDCTPSSSAGLSAACDSGVMTLGSSASETAHSSYATEGSVSDDEYLSLSSSSASSSHSSRSRSPLPPLHAISSKASRSRSRSKASRNSRSASNRSRTPAASSSRGRTRTRRSSLALENPEGRTRSCSHGGDEEEDAEEDRPPSRPSLTEEDRAIFQKFSFPKTTSRKAGQAACQRIHENSDRVLDSLVFSRLRGQILPRARSPRRKSQPRGDRHQRGSDGRFQAAVPSPSASTKKNVAPGGSWSTDSEALFPLGMATGSSRGEKQARSSEGRELRDLVVFLPGPDPQAHTSQSSMCAARASVSSSGESRLDQVDSHSAPLPADSRRANAPRDDSRIDVPREDPRADAPREDPRADAPREDPRADTLREGFRADTPREDPRADPSREDPRIDVPREDSRADTPHSDSDAPACVSYADALHADADTPRVDPDAQRHPPHSNSEAARPYSDDTRRQSEVISLDGDESDASVKCEPTSSHDVDVDLEMKFSPPPQSEDAHGDVDRDAPPPMEDEVAHANVSQEYQVETIVGRRLLRNRLSNVVTMQYFVKWKDYPPDENSWEPQLNLVNVRQLTDRFDEEYPRSMRERQAMRDQRERVREDARERCVDQKVGVDCEGLQELELGEYIGGIDDEEASRVYEVVVQTITSGS